MAERVRRPTRLAVVIGIVGLLLTGLSSWASARVDSSTEQRLLEVQTKQVGAVLGTTIQLIQGPLTLGLTVQPDRGPADATAFRRALAGAVGPDKVFASAALWQRRDGRLVRVARVGATPLMPPRSPATQAWLRSSFDARAFTVDQVSAGAQRRVSYALGDRASGFVVYAERALPASRRSPVDSDSAFTDLHYAIYIGPRTDLASLSTTDTDPRDLPLRGTTATTVVPFGDTVLTVVTAPRHHLGASLSKRLPVILLLGGTALTLVAAAAGQQLARRRQRAEENAVVVQALYDQVEELYGQERVLSERLQRALLPPFLPDIPRLEVAVEYVAGAHGVDIGGDWYSIVALDDDRFAFVVGDVSGHGIDAVAVMARARFTLRAYLLRGDDPATALEMCSHQFDITTDGHIATTVVGVGSWRTGEITVANAGHPPPLLLDDGGAEFLQVSTGPPLGTGPTTYRSTTFTVAPGATLFCFTDGLVERRGEDIDTGMQRLARTVEQAAVSSTAHLVAHTVRTLRCDDADDDIAVLALRRRDAD